MAKVTCGRCRHSHPLGARVCEACGSTLFALELRRAMGRNPYSWLQGTAVGQMAPFFLVAVLLTMGLLLGPSAVAVRQLLLGFGLVGMLTLGVTFPLMKGHYDFSTGSVAGLAACTAALLSPHGYLLAIAGAMAVGLLLGAINGYLSGRTRISSAMVTIMTGAVALQLVMYATSRADLAMAAPELQAIGETSVGGIPVILALFVVTALVAKLLLNQPAFTPIGATDNRLQVAELTAPDKVMLSFLISGAIAGLAGLLISCSSMAIIGPAGQMVWMLTPLTAALIGGGSITAGLGNLRTAAVGAAAIALINWLVNQLRMPIAGPVVEAPLLVIGLLADRWQNMTAYMIGQARKGNLLALPEDMQLPMVVRVWRQTSWPMRITGALGTLALFAGVYVYFAFYVVGRVPEGTAIVSDMGGVVQVMHRGKQGLSPAVRGEALHVGDLVVTGASSHAFLRLHDGSEMRLFQNSEMEVRQIETLENGGVATNLAVNVGAFFAKVRKMVTRDSSFSVQTPLLTLGVRGTAFQLEVGRQQGAVAVNEGAVSIKRGVKVSEAFGYATWGEDERTIEAGKRANAGETTVVQTMSKQESDQLTRTEDALKESSRQNRLEALQSRAPKGLWVFIIVGYLIFIALLKPEPHVYIADVMSKRADYFTSKHARSAADSPRSAALAQMHIRAGNWDEARAEIQSIIEHDPNSDYGAWAQRFRTDMERQRRRIGR